MKITLTTQPAVFPKVVTAKGTAEDGSIYKLAAFPSAPEAFNVLCNANLGDTLDTLGYMNNKAEMGPEYVLEAAAHVLTDADIAEANRLAYEQMTSVSNTTPFYATYAERIKVRPAPDAPSFPIWLITPEKDRQRWIEAVGVPGGTFSLAVDNLGEDFCSRVAKPNKMYYGYVTKDANGNPAKYNLLTKTDPHTGKELVQECVLSTSDMRAIASVTLKGAKKVTA